MSEDKKYEIDLNQYNIHEDLTCKVENTELYLPFKIDSFADDQHEKRFIRSVKKLVRSSLEYKEWTNYLIDVLQLTSCIITGERLGEVKIEFHHHPISMENIVTAVVDKFMDEKIKFSTFDVAYEIMKLHFEMKIGVVPLVTTMHQKFHNGYLTIPIDSVIGDYNYFLKNYPVRADAMEVIHRYIKITKGNQIGWKNNNNTIEVINNDSK